MALYHTAGPVGVSDFCKFRRTGGLPIRWTPFAIIPCGQKHVCLLIYATNRIERLRKDFRQVTRMRGALPDEDAVIVRMGKTATTG